MRVLFVIVTDPYFFPGTVSAVNSIRYFDHSADIAIIENNKVKARLTSSQRNLLNKAGVTIYDADYFNGPQTILRAWELKAHASHRLAASYDVLVGMDADCILCSNMTDVINEAYNTGAFIGGQDGFITFNKSFASYGIPEGSRTPYMSTSLYCCRIDAVNLQILREWSNCCNFAVFNKGGDYAGHGDQGVLNVVLYKFAKGEKVRVLENAIWSEHWRYWQDVITYENGILINRTAGGLPQRSLHCGGGEKYWTLEHWKKYRKTHPHKAAPYAWFLFMLWFGMTRLVEEDPQEFLDSRFKHLGHDLVEYSSLIGKMAPNWRLFSTRWPLIQTCP